MTVMWAMVIATMILLYAAILLIAKIHRDNMKLRGLKRVAEEYCDSANYRVHRLCALAKMGEPYDFRIIQSTRGAGLYELEQFGICSDALTIGDLDEFFAYHEMMLKEGSSDLNISDVFMKRLDVIAELKNMKD